MLIAGMVFLLGVCIGSFTNVLILRLPESQSVVSPGSHCRACGRPLPWYENVPLLSWIALGGRCRGCRAPISVQYPLVELAVGVLFAGNFLLYGPGIGAANAEHLSALTRPEWVVGAVFTTILLAIALTDVRTYLIPDELSLGGMVCGFALSFLPGGLSWLQSVVGLLAGGVLLLAVAWLGGIVFRKEAMGGGDIKMMAMVGAFTGWEGVFLTLFVGAVLGSVVYGPIAIVQRFRRSGREPLPVSTTVGAARTSGAAGAPEVDVRAAGAGDPGAEAVPEPQTVPDLEDESSGLEMVDRGLVPFGFFLAPAAALTFYTGNELVRGYLRLVGLEA